MAVCPSAGRNGQILFRGVSSESPPKGPVAKMTGGVEAAECLVFVQGAGAQKTGTGRVFGCVQKMRGCDCRLLALLLGVVIILMAMSK